MTAITGPRRHRSLLGSVVGLVASRARAKGRPPRVAVALVKVRENLGTLAAMGAMDAGGFLTVHAAGWFFVAASILAADWVLQG